MKLYNIGEQSTVETTYLVIKEHDMQQRRLDLLAYSVDTTIPIGRYPHFFFYTTREKAIDAYVDYQESIINKAIARIEIAQSALQEVDTQRFELETY